MKGNRPFGILFLLVTFAAPFYAANITIPTLELISRAYAEDDIIKIATRGLFNIQVDGGYKFGGRLSLEYESDDLFNSSDESSQYLAFKTADISINNIFNLPVSVSYFAGVMESFCSGDNFLNFFGTPYIGTSFRGFLYFPDSVKYDGIHSVDGTGLKISSQFDTDWFYASLYGYQDNYLGEGNFSLDLHTLMHFPTVNIEAFAGTSYAVDTTYGLYRGGILFYYKPSQVGEFLTEIGIPKWDPGQDEFNINLFYFLFEPRINLNLLTIIPTFFLHPSYYLQEETGQTGAMDLNINFRFGDLSKTTLAGGLESTFAFGTYTANSFNTIVSPYISFITSGVQWDIKLNTQVFPFDTSDMFEGFIGITAEL